jgi:hypothetical protein
VLKTTYLIMHACAEPCCADSPDSPTFAMPCHADSPDSPTFAEPCCADSPNSPTFAKPCCADSPDSRTLAKGHFREKCDSPWHIRSSNSPFSRIWGEWPLLNFYPITTKQKASVCIYSFWVNNVIIFVYFSQINCSYFNINWFQFKCSSNKFCNCIFQEMVFKRIVNGGIKALGLWKLWLSNEQ